MLFGHGDDYFNAPGEVKINFSSNVWHGADLSGLQAHLNARFDCLKRYPEPDAGSLKSLIAHRFGVGEENLIVTNGSITAFYLIAQAWRGGRSAILSPSFAEYEDACRLYGHEVSFFPALEFSALSGPDLCWICNPNNPDGRLMRRQELLDVLTRHPETCFVIDQAYADFTTEELLHPTDVLTYRNLILIQSISKAYDTPGLRMGYLVACPELVDRVAPYLIPWSVNALAVEAGKYILNHPEQFVLPVEKWQRETADLIDALNQFAELEALPTSVTFFLVRLRKGTAAALKSYLLTHGILIRDASNFRGLDETYFRLSTQTPTENTLLLEAIREWLSLPTP